MCWRRVLVCVIVALTGIFSEAFQQERRNLLRKTTGILNVIVIPIEWTDNPSTRELPTREFLEEMWNGEGVSEDFPSGSIKNWTSANSYGQLELTATVVDWIKADNTELFYADGRAGRPNGQAEGTPQIEDLIAYALNQLLASGFDFSSFDQNDDGRIDSIALMHSGYGADRYGEDCDTGRTFEDRIFSHRSVGSFGAWSNPEGTVALGSYTVSSVFRGECDARPARIGMTTHEFVHNFDIPELYDVGGMYTENGRGVGGISGYGVMANAYGPTGRGTFPGHLSPWTKYQLDWVQPTEITVDGTYTLRPSELFPDVYMITAPYPEGEYLMLEVRRPLLFDGELWAPGGLLIYHVDENATGPGNQVRGFPGQDGWPGNGNHYVVALLQRDGEYNLEKTVDNGGMGDFWIPGSTLGPGNGETVATDAGTYPNTDSYANGNIQVIGFSITNIVDNVDGSVTFDVINLAPPEDTEDTVGDCRILSDEMECVAESEQSGCVWCIEDNLCQSTFTLCTSIDGKIAEELDTCGSLALQGECTELSQCFWCSATNECRRSEAECPTQGRVNECHDTLEDDCDESSMGCLWSDESEICLAFRGNPGNQTSSDLDGSTSFCPLLVDQGNCTSQLSCRWCSDVCQAATFSCENDTLGELGNPCLAPDSEETCTSILGCLWCTEAGTCQKASNGACVETESTNLCVAQIFEPECIGMEECQWCKDTEMCRESSADCFMPTGETMLEISKNQGSTFAIRDAGLGELDPNTVTVVLSYLHEISEEGNIIESSLVDLDIQSYDITQTIGKYSGGVEARRIRHLSIIDGVGSIQMDVFVILGSGTITAPGETASWPVESGDVKFNIQLTDWSFCGDEDSACGKLSSGVATNETTAFVDITFEVHGLQGDPNSSPENLLLYDLGGNVPLFLSNQIEVDGFVQDMPEGFPRTESSPSQGTIFVARFPRFNEAVEYDPIIGFHYSIPFVIPPTESPSTAPSEAPTTPPTSAPTSSPQSGSKKDKKDGSGLSTGAVIGISIVAVLLSCSCCIAFVVWRKRGERDDHSNEKANLTVDGDEQFFQDEENGGDAEEEDEESDDDDEDDGTHDDSGSDDIDDDDESDDDDDDDEETCNDSGSDDDESLFDDDAS